MLNWEVGFALNSGRPSQFRNAANRKGRKIEACSRVCHLAVKSWGECSADFGNKIAIHSLLLEMEKIMSRYCGREIDDGCWPPLSIAG